MNLMSRQPEPPDRAPFLPGHPGESLRRDVSVEVRDICARYDQHYNTGPLHRQLGSVARKIFRARTARTGLRSGLVRPL